ncbi:MAG: CDP-diacylglycerol--glycerol-3-phosphate 3-phosphatidyltransferase [Desulfatirhabdiaceae bacterium]|nr:CDP-diacylglycerol--glycerol-3-phosphate 3-phosphatidyltransferase [Desulfatirhabdiaceae bacterium]
MRINRLQLDKLSGLLSHPNFLTMCRVAAVPGIILLMLCPNRLSAFVAAILFSAAAITDYFDGFFARSRGLTSEFGKMMDPLADKLLVSSAFIMIVSHGWIPGWVICIIIGREIAITGLRSVMVENNEDISASNLGKYKTGFQIAAVIPLLIHYPYFGINFHGIGMFFLWGSLIYTVWSGLDYWFRFKRFLDKP